MKDAFGGVYVPAMTRFIVSVWDFLWMTEAGKCPLCERRNRLIAGVTNTIELQCTRDDSLRGPQLRRDNGVLCALETALEQCVEQCAVAGMTPGLSRVYETMGFFEAQGCNYYLSTMDGYAKTL